MSQIPYILAAIDETMTSLVTLMPLVAMILFSPCVTIVLLIGVTSFIVAIHDRDSIINNRKYDENVAIIAIGGNVTIGGNGAIVGNDTIVSIAGNETILVIAGNGV